MAPKFFFALLAAAIGISSVSAAALPEAAPVPAPFTIPDDVEILDLRTDEDKKVPLVSYQPATIQSRPFADPLTGQAREWRCLRLQCHQLRR